jgi:hypothetical protein
MIPATRLNGIDVPLVFNEMGVMADPLVYSNDYFSAYQQPEINLSINQRMQNELLFWNAILENAKDMGIGVCAYRMQTGVWSAGNLGDGRVGAKIPSHRHLLAGKFS